MNSIFYLVEKRFLGAEMQQNSSRTINVASLLIIVIIIIVTLPVCLGSIIFIMFTYFVIIVLIASDLFSDIFILWK